jgi:hypothetical protein
MPNAVLLQVIGVVLTVLIGSGAVAFFVRYGTRLTLQEEMNRAQAITLAQLTATVAANSSRLISVETTISAISQSLSKLSKIDSIDTKLEYMADAMKQIVPRSEHEARFQATERRIDQVHDEVEQLRRTNHA